MSNDNVTGLIQPGEFDDQLTEILRNGARALLAQAVEAEVADFLGKHAYLKTEDGHQRVVRHGHLPEPARSATCSCPHSIRRVATQSIRDVAMGSIASLSHQAASSPELWLSR